MLIGPPHTDIIYLIISATIVYFTLFPFALFHFFTTYHHPPFCLPLPHTCHWHLAASSSMPCLVLVCFPLLPHPHLGFWFFLLFSSVCSFSLYSLCLHTCLLLRHARAWHCMLAALLGSWDRVVSGSWVGGG